MVEGIHQPVTAESTASPEMSLLPQPPAETPGERQPARISGTDADRLREKYKRVGDAQGHVFGEGLPGSRPPDFNLDPGAVKPRPPAVAGAKLPADVKPPASPPAKPDGSAVKPPPEGGRNPEAPAPAPPGP